MPREQMVDFLGGVVGGVLRIPVGHPFDTVKVNLQCNPRYGTGIAGMQACFRDIVRKEGLSGIYKGAQSPLAGMAALNAVLFMSGGIGYDVVRRDGQKGRLTTGQFCCAGNFAGVWTSFVEGPVDYVKCQLQMRPHAYDGFFDCMRAIVRHNGWLGLFHGLAPTLARNIPAYGLFFAVYERSREALVELPPARAGVDMQHEVEALPALKMLLAGGVAGCAFWGFTYPIDVVKSTVQSDNTVAAAATISSTNGAKARSTGGTNANGQRQYAGALDAARKIYRAQGARGFLQGFWPCILRAFPANAAAWSGYEYTKRLMGAGGVESEC